jgi:hypothetical protein
VQGANPWDYDFDQSEHSFFAVCYTKTHGKATPLPCVVFWYTAKKTAVQRIFAVRWFLSLPCMVSLPCVNFCHYRAVLFAVRLIESLPCVVSLPCIFRVLHGKDFFAVREHTGKKASTAMSFFPVVLSCALCYQTPPGQKGVSACNEQWALYFLSGAENNFTSYQTTELL